MDAKPITIIFHQAFIRVITYKGESDGEPHILSVHRRDGSFYIIGGERECRVFRCKDQDCLGNLLYTDRGRMSLKFAIMGNGTFRYVEFDKNKRENMCNVLLVPKVILRPVCRKWDIDENRSTCSLGYQVIRHDKTFPKGPTFVVSFMETTSASIIDL